MLKEQKPPKVFIGLRELAGNNQALCKGLNSIGIETTFINWYGQSTYAHKGDEGFWVKLASQTANKRDFFRKLICSISRRMVFVWALFKFDVFFFSTDQSFLNGFWDLPILKLFGKRIVFQFHGTDSRLPWMNCAYKVVESLSEDLEELNQRPFSPNVLEKLQILEYEIHKKAKRIQTIERYADAIIDCPEHAHLLTKPFIHRIYLGRPTAPCQETIEESSVQDLNPDGTIRILHCPSRRKGKGSHLIKAGIRQLQKEGLPIIYTELFRVPNNEVVQAMLASDLIIDQVLDDIGYSGIATEAALMGKPALIAGYNALAWQQRQADGLLPPFAVAHTECWIDTLRALCQSPHQLKQLGQQAQTFVKTQWQLGSVAERYLKVLTNQYPKHWQITPKTITYQNGWGLLQSELNTLTTALKDYQAQKLTTAKTDVFLLGNTPLCELDPPFTDPLNTSPREVLTL